MALAGADASNAVFRILNAYVAMENDVSGEELEHWKGVFDHFKKPEEMRGQNDEVN